MVFDIDEALARMWYRDWISYIKRRLNEDKLNIWGILRDNIYKINKKLL